MGAVKTKAMFAPVHLLLTHCVPFLYKMRTCLPGWGRGLGHCSLVWGGPAPAWVWAGTPGCVRPWGVGPMFSTGTRQRVATTEQCLAGGFSKKNSPSAFGGAPMSMYEVKSLLFPPTRPCDSLTGDILTLIFKYLPWSSGYQKSCVRYFVIRLSHFVSAWHLLSCESSRRGEGVTAVFRFSSVTRWSKRCVRHEPSDPPGPRAEP